MLWKDEQQVNFEKQVIKDGSALGKRDSPLGGIFINAAFTNSQKILLFIVWEGRIVNSRG